MARLRKVLGWTAASSGIVMAGLVTIATVTGAGNRSSGHSRGSVGPDASAQVDPFRTATEATGSIGPSISLSSLDIGGLLRMEHRTERPTPPVSPPMSDASASSAPSPSYAPLVPYQGMPVAPPDRPLPTLASQGFEKVSAQPVSTFSIDVDTGAWPLLRQSLIEGRPFDRTSVRTEELVNYFRYSLPAPADRNAPFAVSADVGVTPWNPSTRLVRVALRGYDVARSVRPPANLVFLVDVSGSMSDPGKLSLVKQALSLLADRMGPRDRISIVTYAGESRVVLRPTSNSGAVRSAIASLETGGGTNGEGGIRAAYELARASFIRGGVNRIMLATDGDFNVGLSGVEEMKAMVASQREAGITMSTLGFGGSGGYSDAMMEQVADVGNGNYSYIDSLAEARKVLADEMEGTVFTIAHDVKIQVEFNPAAVSEYRLVGYVNRRLAERDFDDDAVDAGEIGSGHQVTALYEVMPAGGDASKRHFAANRGVADRDAMFVKLRYKLPGGQRSVLMERTIPTSALTSRARVGGDLAFAAAVAAFGQKIGGDPALASFGSSDIIRLAGRQTDPLRVEFLRLVPRGVGDGGSPVRSYEDRRAALMGSM